ncbi:MAG: ribonuclease T2 family protein [Terriglobales bacterium]
MKPWVASCLLGAWILLLAMAPTAWAKHHRRHHDDDARSSGSFDYYLLALSWAPNYCAGHPNDHSSECKIGGHTAFVLHGLWPQANSGAPPMSCSTASPVATATVDHMLNFMPSRGLIQHEWQEHGTCTGLSAQDYFAKAEQAFKKVQVPEQYPKLDHSQRFSVAELEKSIADANHAPAGAFRISCHAGELVSLEVCVDKDLHYQSCTQSVRECPVNQVDMRPPR